MKPEFSITSSSSLLPGHKCWNEITEVSEIFFSEYGAWHQNLASAGEDRNLICHIHLQDILDPLKIHTKEKVLGTLVSAVEGRLSRVNKTTILVISSNSIASEIAQVRTLSENWNCKVSLFQQFADMLSKHSNFFLIDFDEIIHSVGANKVFDSRNWYYGRCRFSSLGMSLLVKTLKKVIDRQSKPASKVLVLDCDNTLWGGVVGEEKTKNLIIGQDGVGSAFQDFQRSIVKKLNDGLLLALASKNEQKDVHNVFESHPGMVLKRKHITSERINWREKHVNIKAIAEELGLGLNSIVFWDDNPLEREKMKTFAPEVTTIDVPKDVLSWPALLDSLDCLAKFEITEADRQKHKQYKVRAKFQKEYADAANVVNYLKSIELSPKTHALSDETLARAHQISQKTNQFNLTIKRFSQESLVQKKNDVDKNFLVELSDIFGNHGLVALVCTRNIGCDGLLIENIMMSCRVLGRNLEAWIFNCLREYCESAKVKFIIGEYKAAERNGLVSDLLEKHGFQPLRDAEIMENVSHLTNGGQLFFATPSQLLFPGLEAYND